MSTANLSDDLLMSLADCGDRANNSFAGYRLEWARVFARELDRQGYAVVVRKDVEATEQTVARITAYAEFMNTSPARGAQLVANGVLAVIEGSL